MIPQRIAVSASCSIRILRLLVGARPAAVLAIAGWVTVAAFLSPQSAHAQNDPREVAREVFADRGYPDRLRIRETRARDNPLVCGAHGCNGMGQPLDASGNPIGGEEVSSDAEGGASGSGSSEGVDPSPAQTTSGGDVPHGPHYREGSSGSGGDASRQDTVFSGAGRGEQRSPGAEADATQSGRDDRGFGGGRSSGMPSSAPMISAAGSVLGQLLLGLMLVLVVGFLAFVLLRLVPRRGERAPSMAETVPDDVVDSPMPTVRIVEGDPDELAAAGRFGEAIEAVLYRALRLSGWSPEGRARSQTARETVEKLGADDARRPDVSAIVTGAERVRFGGEPPGAARYRELRAYLENLRARGLGTS